jgi:aminopeptidase N
VAKEPVQKRLADYRPPAFLVDSISLTFDLDPEATKVRAESRLRRNPARDETDAPLELYGDGLKLLSLQIDGGEPVEHLEEGERLDIAGVPNEFTLLVETEIAPARNTRLEGLYLSNGTFCTQCEAEGFRRITWFPDRPDVMTTYRVTIRADKKDQPVLLSNGNLEDSGELPDGRHYAVWHDPFPKPSYLFALVAGDLGCLQDSFATMSGRDVDLRIYTHHGFEDRCAYAMDSLKRAMVWDERTFGLEYDLDRFNIVAINDFNMGAMENKSLNVFNAKYILADAETATDDDYAGIETVVGHEYFHNWTGNRVTCRDWFQLSLKEGLTVFRDQLFSADERSASVKRTSDVRNLRTSQFPEDGGPTAHPVRPDSYIEINNFYTSTVYDKGAEVIGMYQTLLGAEGFSKGLNLYFQRHDGHAVTTDDFLAAMSDANGRDLGQFRRWYTQAGTPVVSAKEQYEAAAQRYTLTLRQNTPPTPGQPEKKPMHIPLAVGLIDPEGHDVPLDRSGATTRVLDLTEAEQSFTFEGVPAEPVLSLNRNFSAPVRLQLPLDRHQRAFLMRHDRDPFNRWEAGQQYATELLQEMTVALQRSQTPKVDPGFIEAMRSLLTDEQTDPAFRALAGIPPREGVLADEMENADPASIHIARELLRQQIAEGLRDELLALYLDNRSNAPFSPDAEGAGRRALKNMALGYLSLLDEDELQALAVTQYRDADNMTDRMAALAVLGERPGEAREAALADFHDRFRDDPVTIDKWLSVQARSSLPDTLARITSLLDHPVFSLKVPNRVRALIGSFSAGNPYRFHEPDGNGYRFLADRVVELDPINPLVAARLVGQLARWRRYDPGRQAKMKAELRRIFDAKDLSRDVCEIVSKALTED